ncbi:MAG TPA: hypothetical protein EYP85_10990 [Armatimonadetes bacterium]|nr:hypothetical protein [Armatimonadota bacterium]
MDASKWTQGLLYGVVTVGALAVFYALLLTYVVMAAEPLSSAAAERRTRLRELRRPLRRWSGFLLGLGLLLGFGVFLVSLLKVPPFAAGGALGFGFLLGLAVTLLAALFLEGSQVVGAVLLSEDPDRPRGLLRLQPGAVVTALLGWGMVAVVLTGWLLKSDPLTAYLGLCCGAWFVTWAVGSPLTLLRPQKEGSSLTRLQAATLHSALLLVFASSLSFLALGVSLGMFHPADTAADLRLFPLGAGAGLVLALAVAGLLTPPSPPGQAERVGKGRASRALSVALLFGGTGIVAWLAWRRLVEEPAFPYPLLCGLLSGAFLLGLAVLLQRETARREPAGDTFLPAALQEGFVLAFLLLSTVVVAFLSQRGFGVALAGLGLLTGVWWWVAQTTMGLKQGWARALRGAADQSTAPAEVSPGVNLGLRFLNAALVFLVLMVVFRLFYERTPLGRGRADLYYHYTFIGLLLGLVLPFALSALYAEARARLRPWREAEAGSGGELPIPVGTWLDWLLTGGLVMAAGPALVVFLWGPRGAAGFSAGLVVEALLFCLLAPVLLPRRFTPDLSALLDAALFTLPLLGLATVQVTRLLEPLSQAKREVKLLVMLAALGVAVVWGAVRWTLTRRGAKE